MAEDASISSALAKSAASQSDGCDVHNREDQEEDAAIGCLVSLEKLNLGPRKKLIVLSLNGLLVYRVFFDDKLRMPKTRIVPARYGKHLVFKRPFCDEFMRFCFERFEVGIWSSALERNVEGVLGCVMGDLKSKLLFEWDQEQCTDSGFKSLEKVGKPLYLKELQNLWGKINKQFLKKEGNFSATNTLLIDDKPYKGLLNPLNTGIYPKSYKPGFAHDDALDPNGELCLFLDGLAKADDVQSYVKTHSFGQKPVTPSHPQWFYYSKIIRRLSQRMSSIEI
ncbi:uncharacterized protein LOC110822858 [Carica papaya]|uniref:uncharacterized protein LOC110822858 n=1 Tax=Carica papaya TaxID=3649 RepID=UPI000B8CC914|nr:uncharacterized protein LOC110822858 [Carica papaya]